jgi:hypothetical protein
MIFRHLQSVFLDSRLLGNKKLKNRVIADTKILDKSSYSKTKPKYYTSGNDYCGKL